MLLIVLDINYWSRLRKLFVSSMTKINWDYNARWGIANIKTMKIVFSNSNNTSNKLIQICRIFSRMKNCKFWMYLKKYKKGLEFI